MNMLLYYSSWCITVIHLFAFWQLYPWKYNIPVYIYAIGLVAAIVNHGTTNHFVKYIDRVIVTLAFLMNLYISVFYIKNTTAGMAVFFFATLGALSYVFSKQYEEYQNALHLITHASVSLSNIILIAALRE